MALGLRSRPRRCVRCCVRPRNGACLAVGPRQPQSLERPNYDLDSSSSLSYFNMEQQAQIIQDYYRVSKGLSPEPSYNVGTRKSLSDYQPYVDQLKSAGSFQGVGAGEDGQEARDRIMRHARGRNAP